MAVCLLFHLLMFTLDYGCFNHVVVTTVDNASTADSEMVLRVTCCHFIQSGHEKCSCSDSLSCTDVHGKACCCKMIKD